MYWSGMGCVVIYGLVMMVVVLGFRLKIKVLMLIVVVWMKVWGGNKEFCDDLSFKGGCRVFGVRGDVVLVWLVRLIRGYEDIE